MCSRDVGGGGGGGRVVRGSRGGGGTGGHAEARWRGVATDGCVRGHGRACGHGGAGGHGCYPREGPEPRSCGGGGSGRVGQRNNPRRRGGLVSRLQGWAGRGAVGGGAVGGGVAIWREEMRTAPGLWRRLLLPVRAPTPPSPPPRRPPTSSPSLPPPQRFEAPHLRTDRHGVCRRRRVRRHCPLAHDHQRLARLVAALLRLLLLS